MLQDHGAAGHAGPAQHKPRLEVADIFREHGQAYRDNHVLGPQQLAVMRAIETCRTAVLGGHLDFCPDCDFERPAYNSCRNRCCPKCQALAQRRWVESRLDRVLPAPHFHVVATLPRELRALAQCNRKLFYDMLFDAASSALLELARDPRHLGALPAITAVLHTWTRELLLHPHVHCIITAGGLSPDGEKWLSTRPGFLFPVRVLAKLFRGKFLDALARAWSRGALIFRARCEPLADRAAFREFLDKLYSKRWHVYSKKPFGGAEQVFDYIGRYTHRTGISNRRLVSMDERGICFATKDGATVCIPPDVFIGRFLLHTLPRGFVKIRHYGLLAPGNVGTKLKKARSLLEAGPSSSPALARRRSNIRDWTRLLAELTGRDITVCPRCGAGPLLRRPLYVPSLVASPSAPTTRDTS